MDKVAEMSVVKRKVEESAEESEPKTVSPGTRKRRQSRQDTGHECWREEEEEAQRVRDLIGDKQV